MKQKYTLTVANSQINIVTEMTKEEIDNIVGIVDRRIREIHLHSKNCSRTDAALLLCLDYCAEKIELQKTVKLYDAQSERLTLLNEAKDKEIESLKREIEALRTSVGLIPQVKATAKKPVEEQIAITEIEEQTEAPTLTNAVDKILAEESIDEVVVEEIKEDVKEGLAQHETVAPSHEEKPHAKARKKKVRAMFDMISFDDI